MVLSGTAQTAGALIAARIILGVGEGFAFPVSNVFVANWFPIRERGRANSVWLSGMNLGPVIAGVLVAALVAAWGWRWAFYGLAAISFVIPLPLVIFLMRDRPRQHRRVSDGEVRLIEEGGLAKTALGEKAEAKQGFLTNYRFWLVTVAWGFDNIYFWGWATWMPTYFRTARHFSFQAAGYLYSLNYLVTLASVLGFGYISDRFQRRAPFGGVGLIFACILMFLGGSIIADPYWSLAVLIVALACQQVGFLMVHPLLQTIVPKASLSEAVGIATLVSFLMAMASPTLAGWLLGVFGFGAVIAFFALAVAVSGILLLCLVREGY
jgi:sugar phosphate permease